MSKYLTLLFLLFYSIRTEGIIFSAEKRNICAQNPIYCQIVKNKPTINRKYAMKLSNLIYKITKNHNINAHSFTAILAQESMYKNKVFNKKSKDYGIAQINIHTAKRFGFKPKKLLNNLEYSLKAGAIILADLKKRYGKKEKYYWTRYNSFRKINREKYKKLVMRYL